MRLLVGCSHLHPWATAREVDGAYAQVFQATLETLEARSFPLETVDRDDGHIVTGKRPVRVRETGQRVEQARARIRGDEGDVRVRLFLTFVDQSGTVRERDPDRNTETHGAVAGEVFSKSAVYDAYLDAIEDRVQELQGRN